MKFTAFLNKFAFVSITLAIIQIAQFGLINSESITAKAIQISNQDVEFADFKFVCLLLILFSKLTSSAAVNRAFLTKYFTLFDKVGIIFLRNNNYM